MIICSAELPCAESVRHLRPVHIPDLTLRKFPRGLLSPPRTHVHENQKGQHKESRMTNPSSPLTFEPPCSQTEQPHDRLRTQ